MLVFHSFCELTLSYFTTSSIWRCQKTPTTKNDIIEKFSPDKKKNLRSTVAPPPHIEVESLFICTKRKTNDGHKKTRWWKTKNAENGTLVLILISTFHSMWLTTERSLRRYYIILAGKCIKTCVIISFIFHLAFAIHLSPTAFRIYAYSFLTSLFWPL